jgi:RNA polymerase sigma-70 factor (ECF subfamily)
VNENGVSYMSSTGSDILPTVPEDGSKSPNLATLSHVDPSRYGARAEDIELVARCRKGDLSAFETIYQRHSASLFNLAYRMVGNASDAEDLLQEIFLVAYNKLSTYQGQAALSTWLYRVATNRCLDYLRSRANRNLSKTDSLDAKPAPLPAPPRESTLARLDLERCIAELPDSYRAAFLLYDVEGFDHREVAEMLGIAEGTSKSLVHKARHKIRDYLGKGRKGGGP